MINARPFCTRRMHVRMCWWYNALTLERPPLPDVWREMMRWDRGDALSYLLSVYCWHYCEPLRCLLRRFSGRTAAWMLLLE